MSRKVNFEKFGGVPMVRVADGGVSETAWNFGVLEPNEEVLVAASAPGLHEMFPALAGKWDGKSTVNHHEAVRKAIGRDLPAQYQRSGTCFPAGTSVLMGDGTERPIERVGIGDEVITHTGRPHRVSRTMKRLYAGDVVSLRVDEVGEPVHATADHPILTPHPSAPQYFEWHPAGQFEGGEDVFAGTARQESRRRVRSVGRRGVRDLPVFNIEVEEEHSYVAGGIAVHNCGGRAGSRALELLQCVLIASGQRATFHPVSHAFIYGAARKEYGMLSGGEGVGGGSVPPVLAKYGAVHRDECDDKDAASPRTDTLANKWGRTGPPPEMYALAKDNIVTAMVKVRSAAEYADGLASGGVGCQSDMQGFTEVRDKYGYCDPKGEWAHYQVRSGVRVTEDGRRGFQYDQSWGEKVPGGALVPGCPGNTFLVEWAVQDGLCRSGAVHVLLAFKLYDLENNSFDLNWLF